MFVLIYEEMLSIQLACMLNTENVSSNTSGINYVYSKSVVHVGFLLIFRMQAIVMKKLKGKITFSGTHYGVLI